MSALPAGLLPRPDRRSALPWLIGTASFLMALAAAAAFSLGRSADRIESAAAGHATIEIVDPDPARRETAAARALALLAAVPDISARRVPEDNVRDAVSLYLGAASMPSVPLPALIDVTVPPGTDMAPITRALRAVPPARIGTEAGMPAPLAGLARSVWRLAIAIVLLSAMIAMLVASIVARSALATHAATIAILHGLGATDIQLAQLIERRTAMGALIGAVFGLIAGTSVIVAIGADLAALNGAGGAAFGLRALDWAMLAALPLAIALIALIAARLTVLIRLRGTA